ncbi:hypothetical protein [Fretibacterium fastidiosum]|uniref:J domain-containing protein n=1 Tax=Fretibacterium fastidiosum TaxID=651822 RepID=A0AB94IWF1_9BACT|nr:hypothetical protein [Fretibacterium fastidiosum]CBL28095.1 hypothetical protein SY1_07760 [Fretibacterium fastidiosum]
MRMQSKRSPIEVQNAIDRRKLWLAYLVFPLISLLPVLIPLVMPGMKEQLTSQLVLQLILDMCLYVLFRGVLFPTVIRFLLLRRGTRYGVETYAFTVLSIVISILACWLVYEEPYFPLVFDFFSAYNILTYRSSGKNAISTGRLLALTGLTIALLAGWCVVLDDEDETLNRKVVQAVASIGALCYTFSSYRNVKGATRGATRGAAPSPSPSPSPSGPAAAPIRGQALLPPWETGAAEPQVQAQPQAQVQPQPTNVFSASSGLETLQDLTDEEAFSCLGIARSATMDEVQRAYERRKELLNPASFVMGSVEYQDAVRTLQLLDRAYHKASMACMARRA